MITLSVTEITDNILAVSAIEAISGNKGSAVLTSDQEAALRRMTVIAAADVAAMLLPRLEAVSFPTADGGNEQITFSPAVLCAWPPPSDAVLAAQLTAAITHATLRMVSVASGRRAEAETHGQNLKSAIAAINRALDRGGHTMRLTEAY